MRWKPRTYKIHEKWQFCQTCCLFSKLNSCGIWIQLRVVQMYTFICWYQLILFFIVAPVINTKQCNVWQFNLISLSLLTTLKLCNHQSTNTLNLRAWYLLSTWHTYAQTCMHIHWLNSHFPGDFGIIHFAILQFAQLPAGDDTLAAVYCSDNIGYSDTMWHKQACQNSQLAWWHSQ